MSEESVAREPRKSDDEPSGEHCLFHRSWCEEETKPGDIRWGASSGRCYLVVAVRRHWGRPVAYSQLFEYEVQPPIAPVAKQLRWHERAWLAVKERWHG